MPFLFCSPGLFGKNKPEISALPLRDRVFLDKTNRAIGKGAATLTVVMVLVTFVIVVLRYGFNLGWIWLQEMVTWMHAAVFLLAAAYTFSEDAHVRVDVFYRSWSQRTKNKVDLVGNVFCLCPLALLLLVGSLDYVSASWEMKESSREAGGLAYPFIPLLKTLLPLTGLMLFSQGLVHAYACYLKLKDD